jgi:hypothetical protein
MNAIRISVVAMMLLALVSTAFGQEKVPLGTTRVLAEGDTIVVDLGGGASIRLHYGRDSRGMKALLAEWVAGPKQGGEHHKDALTFEKDMQKFNWNDYDGGMSWGRLAFKYRIEKLNDGKIKFTVKPPGD